MELFNVDFDNGVWKNIPVLLRDTFLYSWLKALIAPVKYIYGLFFANRNNNLYNLAHNSQVCYLEAALNDTFDNTERRIFISDGPYKGPLYTYQAAESKPLYVGLISEAGTSPFPRSYTYLISESTSSGIQFIVNVPTDVTTQPAYTEAWLRSVVNKYRLASKGYYSVLIF